MLEQQLQRAATELRALTPEPGRGRRQYRDEASFLAVVNEKLKRDEVAGLLRVTWTVEEHVSTCYVGRGRGGAQRPQQTVITRRYVITGVEREAAAIAATRDRLGWRVQLSNAPASISLNACVTHYRANWRGERNYNRLKAQPLGVSPLFVRNDDQIIGLTHLLTLAVRIESVIELQVARGLKSEGKEMTGLYAGLPKQASARPAAVALLQAIARSEITLTHLEWHGETATHLTPLPELLLDVLRYLHLPLSLYTELESNSIFDSSIFRK